MTTHTPGPWRFARLSWGCQVISDSTVVTAISLDVPTLPKRFIEQRIADARLIAAVPELLEALQAMVHYHPTY